MKYLDRPFGVRRTKWTGAVRNNHISTYGKPWFWNGTNGGFCDQKKKIVLSVKTGTFESEIIRRKTLSG